MHAAARPCTATASPSAPARPGAGGARAAALPPPPPGRTYATGDKQAGQGKKATDACSREQTRRRPADTFRPPPSGDRQGCEECDCAWRHVGGHVEARNGIKGAAWFAANHGVRGLAEHYHRLGASSAPQVIQPHRHDTTSCRAVC
ncbi:hypothetical protein BS78_10G081700 [Paspalum vaginatum]|nr:hypothetical protein BS78_10G081700 [Paspalum vaginatum]